MTSHRHSEKEFQILEVTDQARESRTDRLAVEEPMEIRVVFGPVDGRKDRSLSITMRTPGNDFELAAGFLKTEGIIKSADQILGFEFCGPVAEGREEGNIVRVELHESLKLEIQNFQRHFYTTSSCGICGKASLEAIRAQELEPVQSAVQIASDLIRQLPQRLLEKQKLFSTTGGIHAAGLFSADGQLLTIREDVGRHNAVDKLIGCQLRAGEGMSDSVIVVSGRASFELLQKSLVANIPILVAVGAPSSLAVELAIEFGMTLIGFTSSRRFNVYAGAQRVV